MARSGVSERPSEPRQAPGRWVRKVVWFALPLAVLGEIGHQILEAAGQALAHHWFHIAFGAGAVLVFAAYVGLDIRRNGWPTFSWRLRPPEEGPRHAARG